MATTLDHQGRTSAQHRVPCLACSGGGLVPAPGCTCGGSAHTCIPAICTVCMGSGAPDVLRARSEGAGRGITVTTTGCPGAVPGVRHDTRPDRRQHKAKEIR